ncbi:chemotaxis protein CheW [Altererythrobacter sp. Z27]|uniref:chemotaxis protein CheW n=1 Tax=Altererythrobacter sp. Z27 TaxID=3461147 RepID=UPI004043C635
MSELLVLAEVAGRSCAFRAADVQSVIDIGEVTPVPRSPDFVVGLAALRSQVLTVIDCRRAIGQDNAGLATDSRAAVVRVDGHSYALRVDMVDDIASALSEPGAVPGGFGAGWNRVGYGMVETDRGPALLLNVAELIAGPPEARAAA